MPIAMCYLGRECHVSLKLGGGEGVILFWGVLCEGVIFWSLQLANVNKKSVLLADSFAWNLIKWHWLGERETHLCM